MMERFYIYAVSLLLYFLSGSLMAEEVRSHHYPLPDHGNLQLKSPISWKDELRQPPHRLPPTIVFNPTAGKLFEILITPVWAVSKDMPPPNAERIHAQVKQTAEHAKFQAVEQDINIIEIKGASGIGYYLSATDRAPKPDEYKHMIQGMILISNMALAFTILTNDGQENVINDALAMLKGAIHVKGNRTLSK